MKLKIQIFILSLVLLPTLTLGQVSDAFFTAADQFFATHVKEGKVNYKAINEAPSALNELLEVAANAKLSKANADNYRAFWINAYNLAVIKGIIDNYPLRSPLDKAGFFDKTTYQLAGEKITLNDIENKKLRAVFSDARVHFVLVCGALGCPPLISKAYTPANVDQLMQQQTKLALNNPEFIKVKGKKVAVSEIFKWYNEDFVTKDQDLIGFLNKYRTTPIANGSKVTYYSYNWNLNAQ